MDKEIFNSDYPQQGEYGGANIETETVEVSTDSNGDGNATVSFTLKADYSEEYAFIVQPAASATSSYYDDSSVTQTSVDVYIEGAPASTTVEVSVVPFALRTVGWA